MTIKAQDISRFVFSEKKLQVYAVLDGASIENLPMRLYDLKPENVCLYRGELKPDMAHVAPYMVHIKPESAFSEWVFSNGWGKHWGIFLRSNYEMRLLRRHFRKLTVVHNSEGKPLMFRFYDPRVLRVFLPTCNEKELDQMFGPVESFMLKDEESNSLIRYRRVGGVLKVEKRDFTTIEEEELAREGARREKMRQELMPTKSQMDKQISEEDMNKSLVDFWTTINRFDKEDQGE